MYLHFGNPQLSSVLKHKVIRIKVLSGRILLSFVWSYFLFLRLWTISVKPSKKKYFLTYQGTQFGKGWGRRVKVLKPSWGPSLVSLICLVRVYFHFSERNVYEQNNHFYSTLLIRLFSFFAHYPYQCIFLFDEVIRILCFVIFTFYMLYIFSVFPCRLRSYFG